MHLGAQGRSDNGEYEDSALLPWPAGGPRHWAAAARALASWGTAPLSSSLGSSSSGAEDLQNMTVTVAGGRAQWPPVLGSRTLTLAGGLVKGRRAVTSRRAQLPSGCLGPGGRTLTLAGHRTRHCYVVLLFILGGRGLEGGDRRAALPLLSLRAVGRKRPIQGKAGYVYP